MVELHTSFGSASMCRSFIIGVSGIGILLRVKDLGDGKGILGNVMMLC